ncbi:MAG: hybrid sensor histidine kinase/response regulator [Campylobacteraceae bacterium]|nr:hybrid sensor histidine kinase/response regulator [Campylobacteraceae bacterium]
MSAILIAEQDKIVANTLHNLIKEKTGHECIVSNDTRQTLLLLKEHKNDIELIILDLELPDTPEGGLVDPILKLNIPLIIFTKNVEEEEKYRKKNIADYIVKTGPFSIYHALGVVEQIIRNKHINVLVVDGCKEEALEIKKLLATHKLNVVIATDGEMALEIIEKIPNFHLVITEFDLPKVNGVKLIRSLREKYNRNQMAIIVVSSNTEKYVSPKCFKSGANDFIYKGYDREEFYARLNVHLEMISLFDTIKIEVLQKANKEKLLLEDNKMAMIADLLFNISHHWRQPLMAISTTVGSMRMLKELGTSELDKELESLDHVADLTQEMSRTIEMFKDFFSFSKEKEKFSIVETLKEYSQLITTALEEKTIHLIIMGDETVVFEANKENFIQAMINMISNAKEAVEKRLDCSKVILIKVNKHNDDVIEIDLFDSGGGIKEEIAQKIFEPYFSTKEDRNGTGLGLFIARKYIVNEFKGTIGTRNIHFEYEGKKYFGANFKINLPI